MTQPLRTEITQMNKFEDINGRFASLETGMTQSNKFRDRWDDSTRPSFLDILWSHEVPSNCRHAACGIT